MIETFNIHGLQSMARITKSAADWADNDNGFPAAVQLKNR
jgi:hypothetical protein